MYTLEETYYYILEKTDKIGSDFFQMNTVLNRFKSATYEYLDSVFNEIEKTQQVSDKVKPLIIPKKFATIPDPDLSGVIGSLPSDYYHLLSVKPIYADGTFPRKTKLVRHGSLEINTTDPFNKPTSEYPIITQYDNYLNVNTGADTPPSNILIVYIKKPTFAALNEPTVRIVNLPDNVIEEIVELTIKQLFSTTADPRVQIPNKDF